MTKTFTVPEKDRDFTIENGYYEVAVSAVDLIQVNGKGVRYTIVNYKLDNGLEVRYDYLFEMDSMAWKNGAVAKAIGVPVGTEMTFDKLVELLRKNPRLKIKVENKPNANGDMFPKAVGWLPLDKGPKATVLNISDHVTAFDEETPVSNLWSDD